MTDSPEGPTEVAPASAPQSEATSPDERRDPGEPDQGAGALEVGEVVQAMARFMRHHGLFAIGITMLFAAPQSAYILFRAFTVPPEWAAITHWLEGVGRLLLFAGVVLSTFATLTLAFAVHAFQQEEAWSPFDYVLRGVGAIGRGIVMQISVTITVTLGIFAFVLPGLIVGAATVIALPLIAIERCSVPDAWTRCFSLTRGHRWRIGLLALIGLILPYGLYWIAYLSIFPSDDLMAPESEWLFRIHLAAVFEVVCGALMTTGMGVLSATIYTMLIQPTETVDTKALQEVFE